MPIITKPATIQKGIAAEISLDKSALAAVASVAASAYYSDSANWKEVFIYYKSSVGNQREVLKFNATVASPVATFLVSEKARDIFQVQKIVIIDFDNGSITVPRSELTVADFDVDMEFIPAVDSDTSLLLHFNGANLSTSVVDSSIYNRTVSMEGDARISTANYKFGGASLHPSAVTTSANNYVKVNHDGNTLLGTGDFTIEFFLKDVPGAPEQRYIGGNTGTDVSPGFLIQGVPSGFWVGVCNASGNGWAFQDIFAPGDLSQFKHLALVKTGSVYKFFIDGVDTEMNRPVAGTNINFSNLRIGMYENANVPHPCTSFIDEVRISKVARYTSSFTPPTYEFGSVIPSVVWDFASRPEYSLNAQNEIVGSSSGLSYDTSTILFSLSEYTIPANGLELKMVANNGWAIEDAHFFGVCNPSETVFNGFYYAANIGIPSFGVNNILQTPYVYPSTPEVEFKIIIKTTQTEFYVNGVLQSILAPVSNGSPTVKVATRFDNDINIKSSTIVEL